jgi:hypothetical protein
VSLVKVVQSGRGVATHDIFAVDLCGHLDVLTNRKTEDIPRSGQREAIAKH